MDHTVRMYAQLRLTLSTNTRVNCTIYTSLATGWFFIFITNCNYIIFIKSLIFKYIQLYPHTVYRSYSYTRVCDISTKSHLLHCLHMYIVAKCNYISAKSLKKVGYRAISNCNTENLYRVIHMSTSIATANLNGFIIVAKFVKCE